MRSLREALRLVLTSTLSNRRIGHVVGLSHTSIARYRKCVVDNELDWTTLEQLDDAEIKNAIHTSYRCCHGKRDVDFIAVHEQMQQPDATLQILWEEYSLAEPDTAYSYSTFARKYKKFKRKLDLSMRQSHQAGYATFVDFAGRTVPWVDPKSNVKRYAQIFVGVLGASNYTFACALESQSVPDWVHGHNQMFSYFGGVTETLIPDNLKAAVIKAGREPVLNRYYQELGLHYGVVILPARVRHPQDKSKAEVAVLVVTRWILYRLRHRTFFSISEINKAIAELLEYLNDRPFKKLPGTRRSRFEEFDKPRLRALPAEPYQYSEWIGRQKVPLDYHVHVRGHFYSVPFELVGEYVESRITGNTVEIFSLGKRIASHLRGPDDGSHTTNRAHQPESHRRYAEQTPENFQSWAGSIGEAASSVVGYQLTRKKHGALGLRACSSLQRLAKVHGAERFELACRRSLDIGSPTLKSIQSIIRRKNIDIIDDVVPVQIQLPLHHNVRGAAYYADGR